MAEHDVCTTGNMTVRVMKINFLLQAHSWAAVFNTLSPNPVIRVGGADQDRMSQLPAQITWDALKKLRRYTNARFVIGLPLWPKNSIDLSKQIMAAANKNLGSSVIVFELGNEVRCVQL